MQKLINIQQKLKAPKGQHNDFGKYNYRSAEDILEAVKPLLAEEGCQLTLSDEMVQVGDRYYIKATASITDGNEVVATTAYARESETKKGMDDSQITGTASSYARKYALNGLFLIDDTKDADTNEYRKQQSKPQSKPQQEEEDDFDIGGIQINESQANRLRQILEMNGFTEEEVCKAYKVASINALNNEQWKEAVMRAQPPEKNVIKA